MWRGQGRPEGDGAASEAAGMYMGLGLQQAWDSQGATLASQGAALSFTAPPIPGGSTEGGSKKNLLAKSSPARQGSRGRSKKNAAGSRAKSEGPATTYAPWRHMVSAKSESVSPSFEHGTVVTVVTAPQIPGGSSNSAAGSLARSEGQDSRGGSRCIEHGGYDCTCAAAPG